ncbi:MAG: ABC transporter ATP-binding protein, partial [Cytophagaceae bacterium]
MAKRSGSFGEEANAEDKKKFSRDGFKKAVSIFRFVKPYRIQYIIGFVFLLLSTATTLSFSLIIREVTNVLDGKSAFTLNQIILFFVLVLIGQAVFSFFRIYFFAQVSERSMADIRRAVYNRMVTLPIPFFEQRRVGELTSRLSSDVSQLQDVLSLTLAEFFRQIATLIFGTVAILYLSWKLTLFMLATFPLLIVAAMFFGRFIRKMSKQAQDELANASVIVEETLQAINVVKAFTNERYEAQRYGAALSRVVGIALRSAKYRGAFVSFVISALFGSIVGVLWYGGNLVISHEMVLADLITFLFLMAFIGGSVAGMGDLYAQIQRTIGASERILDLLHENAEVDIVSPPSALATPIVGAVAFDNVRF